jgi:two-component system, sensor histidine kinase PdtaS
MIPRHIIIILLLLAALTTNGQVMVKNSLSREAKSELLKSLNKKLTDTARIDILLQLADRYLQTIYGETTNVDSAAIFVREAKEISARLPAGKRNGRALLYESSLIRKTGNKSEGIPLLKRAIEQLKTARDDFYGTMAWMELSRCYDPNDSAQVPAIKNVFNSLFQHISGLTDQKLFDTCMIEVMSFFFLEMRSDSYSLKLDFLEHMARAYKQKTNKTDELWARKEIADIHYHQGNLDMAIDELLEIIKEYKAGGYARISFAYDLLSGLYHAKGSYETALRYSLESVKNVRNMVDSVYLSAFFARVAYNYRATGSTAEAVEWNLKRVNYHIAVNQTQVIYALLFGVTTDLVSLGKAGEGLALVQAKSKIYPPASLLEKRNLLMSLAQCYAALGDKNMTERYCRELIELNTLAIEQHEATDDAIVDRVLALAYLGVGELAMAEKYFNSSLNKMPKGSNALYTSNFLFKLDSAKGNYFAALKHLQEIKKISDSVFTEAKSKQAEELKIVYQTEQKEQNIRFLEKQDQLQKSKLQQGVILRNITFAVVALLIIIMALLYNRYRLKQKTNRKLESQQMEIARQNASLHRLVNEKEWLLKEIHHRVKNNLQIVMSLLNSQSAYIDNAPALTAIHDSQHRVHAMSLIHQKLYNTENVSSIDMSLYIRELVSYLADSFNTGQRIHFEFAVEPIEMDVSQAVPLGLILNEAITNSIKYAFPGARNGVIFISLSRIAPDQCLLTVVDNGIGMPADHAGRKAGSLGMSLMEGLSEDLDGMLSIENANGTTIKVSFVYEPGVKRPGPLTESFAQV